MAIASCGAIALLPRLHIDGSPKEKNACAETRAGVKTGLFDNKLGASLNVMSMVFDETIRCISQAASKQREERAYKRDICQWTISTVNGSASFRSL